MQEENKVSKVLEFFEGNEFAASTFINKYLLKDAKGQQLENDPGDSIQRVMLELANSMPTENPDKEWIKKIYKSEYDENTEYTWLKIFTDACDRFKGVCPQGSILSGAGDKEFLQSLSNCFVLPPPEDSIAGIFKVGELEAHLMKRRGGVGFDISELRPQYHIVKNAAKTSSGAVGWMDFFSNVCRAVGQFGRRGALMLTIDIKHPDVEEFAKIKTDLTKVTGANISIKISDEFMEAVYKNTDFTLQWPINSKSPQVIKVVKAKELWNTIIECAHKSAEPGLIFWDNCIKNLPANVYEDFKSTSTNPSLRAGTLVLTDKGIFPIETLENKEIKVKNLNGSWSKAKCFLSGKNKKLFKVTLVGGHAYYATAEHKWPIYHPQTKTYIKVETQYLEKGLHLPVIKNNMLYNSNNGTWDEGFLIGCNLGDGWQTIRKDGNNKKQIGFCCSAKDTGDKLVLKCLEGIIKKLGINNSFSKRDSTYEININNDILRNLFDKFSVKHKSLGLPDCVWNNSSEEFRLGLLNGLFSTDGSASGGNRKGGRSVSLCSSHKKLIEDVSNLLGFYGIKSNVCYSHIKAANFPNKKRYNRTYERYDLKIGDSLSLYHLKSLIKFINVNKNDAFYDLEEPIYIQNKDKIQIKSVELSNLEEDVWDISVYDDTHCFQLPHCITGNCSEIILSKFDSCRLTTICLTKYTKNKFLDTAKFDFNLFEKDVRIAMRMMDAVVSAEIKYVERIINKIKDDQKKDNNKDLYNNEINLWTSIRQAAINGRRTGLGTHGLADCLAQLQLKYDSEEALKMVDKIYKALRDYAYDESIEMAKEYGSFPVFNYDLEIKNCEFIKRLPKELLTKMKKYGRRNISILTNAPTGTISIISQVSSGIEPTFRQMYIRRRKVNQNEIDAKIDFTDQNGDKWTEFPIFERNVERYFKSINKELPIDVKNDEDLARYLPYYFITSDKINWKKRVELQSTAQQYIDHSISSTINLPNNVTINEVAEVYEHSHKMGLKGVTVYREGSRSGVLVSQKEEETDIRPDSVQRNHAPKRPELLDAEVHITKVKGEEYVIMVGLMNGSVYEVFFGKHNNNIPNKTFSGFIQKHSKGAYTLNYEYEGKLKSIDINKYFNNQDYAFVTRLLSMSLRHGTPLELIIEQLQKSSSSIVAFESAIARILKKYIKIEDLQKRYKELHGDNIQVKVENGCITVVNLDTGVVESKCD